MKELKPEFIKPYLSPVELEYVESLEAQIKQLQEDKQVEFEIATGYHKKWQEAEYQVKQLQEAAGCGCGICLAHNSMVCPKATQPPKEAQ